MSDEEHSNPNPAPTSRIEHWEDYAVFRESFLSLLPTPEAEAFRLLGRRLYFDRHESVRPQELAGVETSTLRRELAAAAADLEVLSGFLSAIGDGLDPAPRGSGLGADRPAERLYRLSAGGPPLRRSRRSILLPGTLHPRCFVTAATHGTFRLLFGPRGGGLFF
jgi:hypothetical protein